MVFDMVEYDFRLRFIDDVVRPDEREEREVDEFSFRLARQDSGERDLAAFDELARNLDALDMLYRNKSREARADRGGMHFLVLFPHARIRIFPVAERREVPHELLQHA